MVRLHSLAGREDASVHTVANDRPMQPTLARRESPYLGPREGPARDTLPNPAGLGDLAVLNAGFGCERHPRAERQGAGGQCEPMFDSFHVSLLRTLLDGLPAGCALQWL